MRTISLLCLFPLVCLNACTSGPPRQVTTSIPSVRRRLLLRSHPQSPSWKLWSPPWHTAGTRLLLTVHFPDVQDVVQEVRNLEKNAPRILRSYGWRLLLADATNKTALPEKVRHFLEEGFFTTQLAQWNLLAKQLRISEKYWEYGRIPFAGKDQVVQDFSLWVLLDLPLQDMRRAIHTSVATMPDPWPEQGKGIRTALLQMFSPQQHNTNVDSRKKAP